MEVVVVFEGGDPDKPLVTGALYNGITPPPFPLPGARTQSGFRTKSSPNAEGYNELSFEDRAGQERIFVRAQRDLETVVQRDRRAVVSGNDRDEIGGDQAVEVSGRQVVRVAGAREVGVRGDDTVRIAGGLDVRVARDRDEHTLGDKSELVDGRDRREVKGESELVAHGDAIGRFEGSAVLVVGRGDAKRSLTARVEGTTQITASDAIEIASDKEIVLRVGTSFVRIGPDDIEIAAGKVAVRGEDARLLLADGEAKTKVAKVFQVLSDQKIVLKSTSASLGLSAMATLDGAKVLLNSPEMAVDHVVVDAPEPAKIELVDHDGKPIPHQRYRVLLDDGSEVSGFLDEYGKAEVPVAQGGKVIFPDLGDVEPG